jgi:hypothetical protein
LTRNNFHKPTALDKTTASSLPRKGGLLASQKIFHETAPFVNKEMMFLDNP